MFFLSNILQKFVSRLAARVKRVLFPLYTILTIYVYNARIYKHIIIYAIAMRLTSYIYLYTFIISILKNREF